MGAQVSKPATQSTTARATAVQLDEKASVRAANHVVLCGDDVVAMGESLTCDNLDRWSKKLNETPELALSRLVLSHADPMATLASRQAIIKDRHVFNLMLTGIGSKHEYPTPRVNQMASGRCWLFATTNVLRYNVIEKLNLGEFQLSQSYLFFYDKIEKANYYLENMIDLADEPLDSRVISWLNQAPVNDGGQWDMAVNLLEKYGVVPKDVFPESFSSSASAAMDKILTTKLREYSLRLRANRADARKLKSAFLGELFNVLTITLGDAPKPDEPFTWEYYSKDGKFHSWTGTPREYYDQFCKRKNMDPKASFSLINDPRNPTEKLYTVDRLGNVSGGRDILYVNAPVEALEDAVIAGIKANTPLFFGCDVGKSSERVNGIMDTALYDTKAAYGFDFNMTKRERLETGETLMTHAMVITAVHLDDKGRPVRYKVENSWSDAVGDHGWYMMTADWFREHVFQVVIPSSVAEKKWVDIFKGGNPVVLPAWDPMGALA